MKIFIDTANLDEIKKVESYGIVSGVTTNPSLIAKEHGDFKKIIEEITNIVDGPISAEVISLEAEGMIKEGIELAKIHKNIVIKLPTTFEGLKACKKFKELGIKTNLTLIFTLNQALLAARAGASYDFGADSAKVAILQLIRMVSVVGILPFIIKFVIKKFNKNKQEKSNLKIIKNISKENFTLNIILKKTLITLFIGTIAGMLGLFLKIPAGAMSIAVIGTAFYNIFSNNAYIPSKLKQFIQILAGTFIGTQMTMKEIIGLKEITIPVIIIIIGFCLMNLILGMIIYKITTFSIQTALFSAAPGGMSDMSIIAEELGADTPKVATMQFCRLITVIAVYPILIKIISNFF